MLKNNYVQWKQNIKTDPNWIPPVDQEFIPHILPILASITLVKNDNGKICPELTYKNIPEIVKTPNGNIAGEQVKALIAFTGMVRRSLLLPKTTQSKYPQYGIYTPLAMYAHKLYHNVGYDQWSQRLSPYLLVFMGTTLYSAYESAKKNDKPDLNIATIKELRKEALTYKSGVKKGKQDRSTSHRCNLKTLNVRSRTGDITQKVYTKYAVMSFLQLWLCHAELRQDSMILDLFDWGNTPKALDATVAKAKVEVVNERTTLDEAWEL